MIKYVTGNFFDYDANIRVNTVNCVGVMGAGSALQFKNKYPEMYKEYAKECKLGRVKIGLPHVWHENEMFNQNDTTIINFPTKDHWKNPSEYEYIEKGLVWLRNYLLDKEDIVITLPALGCGHGGLDWNIVKSLLEKYLANLHSEILVFEPLSSTRLEREQVSDQFLEEHKITRIVPGDSKYPNKLKGKSATTIYIRGYNYPFNRKLLSIIVNTKANEREKNAILKCLEIIPQDDFIYVLGFNSSFEIDIVKTLLNKRSYVLLVLPYGHLQLKVRKDLKPFWNEDLITLVSLSSPNQKWKVNESIKALKFRIKVSDSILIANHDLKSIQKFEIDIKESSSTIFYINYWDKTQDFFNRISARKIGRDRQTYAPNIFPIMESLSEENKY